jgi:signal transduction histidine kinase/DNA-binding LacI/PurR family transcriptional regulator
MICSHADKASDVPRNLWESIRAASIERKCNLLSIVNGERPDGYVSVVFDLIDPADVDGCLFWTQRTDEAAESVMRRFSGRPAVSISVSHADRPTLYLSNRRGMQDLMDHLIGYHGYRKIAFIRGPLGHPGAAERFDVYRERLREAGIPENPDLVTAPGKWHTRTGKEGVRSLLADRNLSPGKDIEVIVCPSDRIAIGAYEELSAKGIRVPDDIALTGFNNLQDAQGLSPSLTTVAVDYSVIGRRALSGVFSQIDGDGKLDLQPSDSILVVGESCRCRNPHLEDVSVIDCGTAVPDRSAFHAEFSNRLLAANPVFFGESAAVDEILGGFSAAIDEGNPRRFIDPLISFLRVDMFSIMEQIRWQDALTYLRRNITLFAHDREQCAKAEYCLDSARVAVADYFSRLIMRGRSAESNQSAIFRKMSGEMGSARSLSEISAILAGSFPDLGFSFSAMICYDEPVRIDRRRLPKRSRLMFYGNKSGRMILPADGLPFEPKRIIPAVLPDMKEDFVLIPIVSERVDYGYFLLSVGKPAANIFASLSDAAARAIGNVIVQHSLEESKRELEKSLRELRRMQKKLIESEKMAAMGELVAGVAHELNTPVGIAVTLASFIRERCGEIVKNPGVGTGSSLSGDLLKIAESADMMMRNLEHASGLIESFKKVAVDQTNEHRQKIGIAGYIRDVVRSLDPYISKGGHQVSVICPEEIEIETYPGSVAQVISNLIRNSVTHGFEDHTGGSVSITCARENDSINIVYSDNGRGMTEEVRGKIFNPFFTTKRGKGGTGLGMNIVYNIVTGKLGGDIECRSSLGHGAEFIMRIPMK